MRNIYLTFILSFFGLLLNCNNAKVKEPELLLKEPELLKTIKKTQTKEFFSLVKPINNPKEPSYKTIYNEYSISINSNSSSQELIFTKGNSKISKVLKFYYENPEIVFHLYKSNFDNIFILIEGRDYYSSNLGVYFLENKSNKIIEIDETLTYNQDNPEAKGFKLPIVEILKNVDNLKCKFYLGDKFLYGKDYDITKIKTKKDNSSGKNIISNNINQYLNNKDYFIKTFDVNKAGIKDKIVSHNRYQGNELLIFLGNKNGVDFNFALKTINFSADGGNQISDIKETKQGFNIITSFPDKGYYEENYNIVFKNNSFILDKQETFSTSSQEGYKEFCVAKNLNYNLDKSTDQILRVLSKADKSCKKIKQ
jgi:hypothetical protein